MEPQLPNWLLHDTFTGNWRIVLLTLYRSEFNNLLASSAVSIHDSRFIVRLSIKAFTDFGLTAWGQRYWIHCRTRYKKSSTFFTEFDRWARWLYLAQPIWFSNFFTRDASKGEWSAYGVPGLYWLSDKNKFTPSRGPVRRIGVLTFMQILTFIEPQRLTDFLDCLRHLLTLSVQGCRWRARLRKNVIRKKYRLWVRGELTLSDGIDTDFARGRGRSKK